jgi:hypothetical protein
MVLTRATQMRQIIDSKQEELNQKSLQRRLCMSDISDMDDDGDGEIDALEWLSKMLVRLNKCEQRDIDEIMHQFNVLDVDKSGKLNFADIARVRKHSTGPALLVLGALISELYSRRLTLCNVLNFAGGGGHFFVWCDFGSRGGIRCRCGRCGGYGLGSWCESWCCCRRCGWRGGSADAWKVGLLHR